MLVVQMVVAVMVVRLVSAVLLVAMMDVLTKKTTAATNHFY